jgi:hypothetical protein
MTLTVGTDTYATLAEADAYAAARAWADWAALTTGQKETRLIEASMYLDTSYTWRGRITDHAQEMSWPRIGVRDAEGRLIDNDAIPAKLKAAQIEYARISEPLVPDQAQGTVSQITAGSVSIAFKSGQTATEAERYRSIDRLLTGLYIARAGAIRNVRLGKS